MQTQVIVGSYLGNFQRAGRINMVQEWCRCSESLVLVGARFDGRLLWVY